MMTDIRTALLIAQVRTIARQIDKWRKDVSQHGADADHAQRIGHFNELALVRAERTLKAIEQQVEEFYALVAENADLPGVRDGQISGIGTALIRLAYDCGTAVGDLRAVRVRPIAAA
jgi:hypothetical protein